jgi:hypothetical protein
LRSEGPLQRGLKFGSKTAPASSASSATRDICDRNISNIYDCSISNICDLNNSASATSATKQTLASSVVLHCDIKAISTSDQRECWRRSFGLNHCINSADGALSAEPTPATMTLLLQRQQLQPLRSDASNTCAAEFALGCNLQFQRHGTCTCAKRSAACDLRLRGSSQCQATVSAFQQQQHCDISVVFSNIVAGSITTLATCCEQHLCSTIQQSTCVSTLAWAAITWATSNFSFSFDVQRMPLRQQPLLRQTNHSSSSFSLSVQRAPFQQSKLWCQLLQRCRGCKQHATAYLRVGISAGQRQRTPLATARQQQYLLPDSIDLGSLSLSAAASAIVLICSSSNKRRCILAAAIRLIRHQLRPKFNFVLVSQQSGEKFIPAEVKWTKTLAATTIIVPAGSVIRPNSSYQDERERRRVFAALIISHGDFSSSDNWYDGAAPAATATTMTAQLQQQLAEQQ